MYDAYLSSKVRASSLAGCRFRAKLHRMRFEISQVVGNIIEKYNVGPTARIVMELLPLPAPAEEAAGDPRPLERPPRLRRPRRHGLHSRLERAADA